MSSRRTNANAHSNPARDFLLRPRDEVADILEEVQPYRSMSWEQRDEAVQQALRFVDWWLRDVDGARQRLEWTDQLSADAEALWCRLVAGGFTP